MYIRGVFLRQDQLRKKHHIIHMINMGIYGNRIVKYSYFNHDNYNIHQLGNLLIVGARKLSCILTDFAYLNCFLVEIS